MCFRDWFCPLAWSTFYREQVHTISTEASHSCWVGIWGSYCMFENNYPDRILDPETDFLFECSIIKRPYLDICASLYFNLIWPILISICKCSSKDQISWSNFQCKTISIPPITPTICAMDKIFDLLRNTACTILIEDFRAIKSTWGSLINYWTIVVGYICYGEFDLFSPKSLCYHHDLYPLASIETECDRSMSWTSLKIMPELKD